MSRRAWEKALTAGGQVGFGGRGHKYGAKPMTTADGVWHPSSGQGRRWAVLQQAQYAGLIKNLQREVAFDLVVNGVKVCQYVADHTFTLAGELAAEKRKAWLHDGQDGPLRLDVVEDFKGTVTDVARIKMKLFAAVMGYEVTVVKTPKAAIG